MDDCSNVTWGNNYSGINDDCGAAGSATVTFTATDDCGNDTTIDLDILVASVDIVKTFTDDVVIAGGSGSSFTLVVKNDGSAALSNVLITDTVDDRLGVTSVSGTAGSNADTDGNAQTVQWLISSLAPGASATITVYFSVDSDVEEANGVGALNDTDNVPNSGTVNAEATDDSSVKVSDSDNDSIDIEVDIDLSIVKTFIPAAIQVPQGTFQQFTLVVTNNGPSDATGDSEVSVTDLVDSSLEVTAVNITSAGTTGTCTASVGQSIDCTLQLEAGESATITVDYTTSPFLDADTPYPNIVGGGDDFRFVFVNGSVLEGTTRGQGLVLLDGVDITSDVTIIRSLTRNDIVFDPPGSDPAFELHLSCSDPFTGGWGQSGGPVKDVDTNWQIAFFTIARFNNNGFIKSCGNVVNEYQVDNTGYASGDDTYGTESAQNTASVKVGPGILLDRLQTNGKRLTVRLTNLTGENKVIDQINAEWPESNGELSKVWLTFGTTTDVVWQGTDDSPDAELSYLSSGWIGGTLLTGEAILRFDFANKVDRTPYVIRVWFTDGTWLDISVDGSESNGNNKISSKVEESTVVLDDPALLYNSTTLSAYPSPFTTELNVDVNIEYEATARFQLYDITGRLVETLGDRDVRPGFNRLQFSIYSAIQQGIYVLRFDTGIETVDIKVVGGER